MQNGYTIGRGGIEHFEHLRAVEREAASLFEGRGIPEQVFAHVTTLEEFREAQEDGHLWIAFSPGKEPIGFALIEMLDGQPHLEEIDVLPSHGRRGVGRALIAEVCCWAKQAGHLAITLTTFRDIPWNEPYYARLGFRRLEPSQLNEALQARVMEEAAHGLDPARRVVMRRTLGDHTD